MLSFFLFSCCKESENVPVYEAHDIVWGNILDKDVYFFNNTKYKKKICLDDLQVDSETLKGYGIKASTKYNYSEMISAEYKEYLKNDNFLYEIDFSTGSEHYIPLNINSDFQYLRLLRVHNSKCYFLGTKEYEKFKIITFDIKTNKIYYSKCFEIEEHSYIYGASDKYLYFDTAYYDLNTLEKKQYPFEMNCIESILNQNEDKLIFMTSREKGKICILDMVSRQITKTEIERKFDLGNNIFKPKCLFHFNKNILYYSKKADPEWWSITHILTTLGSYEFTEWYAYNLETKETVKLNCPYKCGYIIGFTE